MFPRQWAFEARAFAHVCVPLPLRVCGPPLRPSDQPLPHGLSCGSHPPDTAPGPPLSPSPAPHDVLPRAPGPWDTVVGPLPPLSSTAPSPQTGPLGAPSEPVGGLAPRTHCVGGLRLLRGVAQGIPAASGTAAVLPPPRPHTPHPPVLRPYGLPFDGNLLYSLDFPRPPPPSPTCQCISTSPSPINACGDGVGPECRAIPSPMCITPSTGGLRTDQSPP